MAVNSTFTPKASLTDAPTNLKEAIDWVLRVTGKDGKKLGDGECICGLAAAVTDLLQSVQLEYNGYQGEAKQADSSQNKGANAETVKEHLNGLFSLVQGLGGTAVVRTYIDQLAQVLSALVGWSRIERCTGGGNGRNGCKGTSACNGGGSGCKYLLDVKRDDRSCETCGCIKGGSSGHLGRGCTKCSGGSSDCQCDSGGETQCTADKCQCALAGKCCKCCCKGGCGCKKEKDRECRCVKEGVILRYRSTYSMKVINAYYWTEIKHVENPPTWNDLLDGVDSKTPSQRRHHCARILLGSVCLIWSGITYMHWTGKWHVTSPYWNNHILDGSGLDDGTLSQWLQALGFPKEMLNNSGPGNRLDAVITGEFSDKLLLGFQVPSGLSGSAQDNWDNTARNPTGMNFAGFIHTAHRDSFNTDQATVFKNGSASGTTDTNMHKYGAIFKLYILSCAYFTGLQKKTPPKAENRTPKTIREILYWLSALPYSEAYKQVLEHSKGVLEKVAPDVGDKKQLSFYQTGRPAPITVDEYNLFAHFQAVTQYCPLVLIGIQGGLHSATKGTEEPAIHSLYANNECHFTYPAVDIQAYNQVVHYIRALFYQLYFLRKQCAVKVALGGKWRECRYGKDVVSKGVISWMCLGCSPMEHDRKKRVTEMEMTLDGVIKGLVKKVDGEEEEDDAKDLAEELKKLLLAIGEVVVQLGNAQEALEGKEKEAINAVKEALQVAKDALEKAVNEGGKEGTRLYGILEIAGDDEATEALKRLMGENGNGGLLGELTGKNGGGALHTLVNGGGDGSLEKAKDGKEGVDGAKDNISEVIHKVREVLKLMKEWVEKKQYEEEMKVHQEALLKATETLKDICNSPKCPSCKDHSTKCGKRPTPSICDKCHQQYMDGTPSPLQAFLEDRLPGFSCREVVNTEDPDKYPPAASHLGHCGGSGQCCPLPMGFRGQFHKGSTSDMTGQRLYGLLYFFSNENMMQSCVYTLVRVTAALSATTPQGGVGNKDKGKPPKGEQDKDVPCEHTGEPSKDDKKYFCGWCASGLRDVVKAIEWITKGDDSDKGGKYMDKVGKALIDIKGYKDTTAAPQSNNTSLSRLTKNCQYLSPLTGELYTAVSATFGNTYLSWVLYLSDALYWGLESLSEAFQQIECRGCRDCDPNKCKKGAHGQGSGQCGCQSIVSCTGVLPVLYRHGFSYGNPFNLEGYEQKGKESGDYGITDKDNKTVKHCHEFLESLSAVINRNKQDASQQEQHPLTNLLSQVGKLQYDIRLPWIFVLTVAWLVAVLYLAFGAIWPLDWVHMRSHCRGWFRKGSLSPWEILMVGKKKGRGILEFFGRT